MKAPLALAALGAFAALAGCSRDDKARDIDTGVDIDPLLRVPPPTEFPPTQTQAEAWIGDAEIGAKLDPAGRVADPRRVFGRGEPLYLVMDVSNALAEGAIRVMWFGPRGEAIRTDLKSIAEGQQQLTVHVADTNSWGPGQYRGETYAGDEHVDTRTFKIASRAAEPGSR